MGKTEPTRTPLIDWEQMKTISSNIDVRNIINTTSGIKAYGGDSANLNKGDIIFKQPFTDFDAICILFTHDTGAYTLSKNYPVWELKLVFETAGHFELAFGDNCSWTCRGSKFNNRPSTTSRFNINAQNCGIIEIYGITY